MKIFAHRGYSNIYPENTMLAFKEALKFDIDGIELDIHLTKDNVPVIFHDEKLKRMTKQEGCISDYTLCELKQFKVIKNEYMDEIPTLLEYLDFIKDKNILTNIEFKTNIKYYNNIENIVFKILDEFNIYDKLIFSSFNHICAKKIIDILKEKNLYNISPVGFLTQDWFISPEKYCLENEAKYFNPKFNCVTKDLVENLHKNNIKIATFTVNDYKKLLELQRYNVDIIFTNHCEFVDRMRDENEKYLC